MSISIVCRNTMLRDMLHLTFTSQNMDIKEAVPDIAALRQVEKGDLVVLRLQDLTPRTRQDIDALTARLPGLAIILICPDDRVAGLRRELGQSVHAIIAERERLDLVTSALKLVAEGYRITRDDERPAHAPAPAPAASQRASATAGDAGQKDHCAQVQTDFSRREMAVITRLRDGNSNKDIANDLGISDATVKVHMRSIFRKANVKNRTQAAIWAMEHL